MSYNNRKGYTTVKVRGARGSIRHVAVKSGGKFDRIAKHRNKQLQKARQERIRAYKDQLREAKKRVPLAERSKVTLRDLEDFE